MSKSSSNFASLILALLILGVTGWQGWIHWEALVDVKTRLASADTVLLDLEQNRADLQSDYGKERSDYVKNEAEQTTKLEDVLPEEENLTQLTRLFDEFAFSMQDFFISQLGYGEMIPKDTYQVLPISMTVETSERNFYQFLDYVETSGSLEASVPLLSIESISIQLSDNEDTLKVQFSLYAYFKQ